MALGSVQLVRGSSGRKWRLCSSYPHPVFSTIASRLADAPSNIDDESWADPLNDLGQLVRLHPRAVRLDVPQFASSLVIKRALPPKFAWLPGKSSRAARAFKWSHYLRSRDLPCPRPYAFLEPASRRISSYFVNEYVEGKSLLSVIENEAQADNALRKSLIQQVAQLLYELHYQGVRHGDLHGQNILVTPQQQLMILDLEAIRSRGSMRRLIRRNFRRLHREFYTDAPRLSRTDGLRFLHAYTQYQAAPEAQMRDLWRYLMRISAQ